MAGKMATVTPPNDRNDKVDGFANVDEEKKWASLVLGGNSVGDVECVFQKVPSFLGGKVKVLIETEVEVKDGSFSVQVKIQDNHYVYRVYLTPASS